LLSKGTTIGKGGDNFDLSLNTSGRKVRNDVTGSGKPFWVRWERSLEGRKGDLQGGKRGWIEGKERTSGPCF